MLDLIVILLFALVLIGVRIMSVSTDIKAAQGRIEQALAVIAAKSSGSIPPAEASEILSKEQELAAAAEAIASA